MKIRVGIAQGFRSLERREIWEMEWLFFGVQAIFQAQKHGLAVNRKISLTANFPYPLTVNSCHASNISPFQAYLQTGKQMLLGKTIA